MFQFTHPGGVRQCTSAHRGSIDERFNSRTREGCDWLFQNHNRAYQAFQFTHPGGVRLRRLSLGMLCAEFQFTHPGGVRLLHFCPKLSITASVSIHAPGRGATGKRGISHCSIDVSIHAPGRGATEEGEELIHRWRVFQFTHPGGVRPLATPPLCKGRRFQFTHPGGVRPPSLICSF